MELWGYVTRDHGLTLEAADTKMRQYQDDIACHHPVGWTERLWFIPFVPRGPLNRRIDDRARTIDVSTTASAN